MPLSLSWNQSKDMHGAKCKLVRRISSELGMMNDIIVFKIHPLFWPSEFFRFTIVLEYHEEATSEKFSYVV